MPRVLPLLAAAILLIAAGPARAQQTVAQYVGNDGQLIFNEDDILTLDAAAKLTDEQKEAARLILRAGAQRIHRTQVDGHAELAKKHSWDGVHHLPEEERAAAYKKISAAWVRGMVAIGKQAAAIELETLRDLRSLLTPEQLERAWPGFERERRRLIITSGISWGLSADPRDLVEACKLEPADAALAAPVLAAHDEAMDVLIQRRMSALNDIAQRYAQGYEPDDHQSSWNAPELMTREINQLNIRTARELEKILPDAARGRLLRLRVSADVGHTLSPPSKDGQVQQLLAIDTLTSEQRRRMKAMIQGADDQALARAIEFLKGNDDVVLRPEAETPEAAQQRTVKAHEAAAKILTTLNTDLRALLTPTQIEDLAGGEGSRSFDRMFKARRRSLPLSLWTKEEPEGAVQGAPLTPP